MRLLQRRSQGCIDSFISPNIFLVGNSWHSQPSIDLDVGLRRYNLQHDRQRDSTKFAAGKVPDVPVNAILATKFLADDNSIFVAVGRDERSLPPCYVGVGSNISPLSRVAPATARY
jgi:hypothetical protein